MNLSRSRICRECSEAFEPAEPHHHTCGPCYWGRRAGRSRPGASATARLATPANQLSLFDAAESTPVEEESEFIRWLDAQQAERAERAA
jgi:hypothetical protein